MSKRATLDLKLKKDDRSDDPSSNLRKKIKTEHDFITSRAKKVNEDLDLTDHEVNKFLIIFHTLLDTIDIISEISEPEETDGIFTDIILQIVLKVSSLIRQNVDSLPLPQILKDALKVIKELFNGKKSMQVSRGGPLEKKLKECASSTSSSSGSSSSETTSTSSTSSSSNTSASTTPSNTANSASTITT